jgi:3-oxoacyl-[acyl-carrier-protein] synthase III
MRSTSILSTGCYLPESIVCNEDLTQFPRGAYAMIEQKTGVKARRVASDDQCTSDLAVLAARNCLEKSGFPAGSLQGIILSTSSPDRIQPATAVRVQHQLKAEGAFAFDINSVCSGSVYGICLADALIRAGTCDNVLFIAAELYSKFLNPMDFSTYPFFGDGAGAILFQANGSSGGVLYSCLRTDGSGGDIISVPGGGTMMPFTKLKDLKACFFRMNGRAVYDFAVSKGAEAILQVLQATGTRAEDIACFVCHQANINILREIGTRTGIPEGKFIVNLDRYGNTASASVPIALDEAITNGNAQKGDLVVTAAFGGGLSWGANLIRM